MTQSMIEKLRLIADCIEQGKEVEYNNDGTWCTSFNSRRSGGLIQVFDSCDYRAKPEKPRTGVVNWTEPVGRCMAYQAIELTPEVHQALKDAGIEY